MRVRLALLLFVSLIGQWSYAQMVELNVCSTVAGYEIVPMSSTGHPNSTSRYAIIYPADQLTELLNQTITSIFYRKGSSTNISGPSNFKIYLKETNVNSVPSSSWATLITGATLVYDSNPVAATAGPEGWKGFLLNTPYHYTGNNLFVLTEYVNTGNTTSNYWYFEFGNPCVNSWTGLNRYIRNTTGVLEPTLTASTSTTGATVSWYAGATSNTALGTGNSFTTPALTSTTTYYAAAKVHFPASFVGKAAPFQLSGNNFFQNAGLIFNALQDITIETIDFYPFSDYLTSTIVKFNLLSPTGTILETKQVNLPVSTARTMRVIDLNFVVPAGMGYRLVVASATLGTRALDDMQPHVAALFPFTIPGVCSITGPTEHGPYHYGVYHYLYNWKVSARCESARQPVVATVDTNCLSTFETAVKNEVNVHPNPFVDVVNISNVDELKSAIVVDAAGRVVKTFDKVNQQLSFVDLKSGMYILKLNMKKGTEQTVKLIKK